MMRSLLSMLLIWALLAGESTQAAETLGRLFFTPAQRDSLDAGKTLKAATGEAAPARRGPAVVKLNGVVVRSDGESTVWVNGQTSNRGTTANNIIATPSADPSSAQVSIPGSASRKMRVGQQLDTRTGVVREGFAPRPRKVPAPAENTSGGTSGVGVPEQTDSEAQATKPAAAFSPAGHQ